MAPAGDNYDLHGWGVSAVLPMVVTAEVEWLADDDAWLDHAHPQICTPDELFRMLEETSPEGLSALAMRIDRN